MKNYFIGYKQANGEYVYVAGITEQTISVTLHLDNAVDFYDERTAYDVCMYVNMRDAMNTYIPILVETTITELTDVKEDVEEVVENDTITNE